MPKHWEPLWSEEYVLDRLWERYKRNLNMNHHAVHWEDCSLCGQAKKRFGSYDQALTALGLSKQLIRRMNIPFSTTPDVVSAIRERKSQGLPLNLQSLKVGPCRDSCLYKGALRLFGSWQVAIEASGMDYSSIKKHPVYSSSHDVAEEIKARYRRGLPLQYSKVERGSESDKSLLRAGIRYFGSWSNAQNVALAK
jgi:hypothetical protein